MSKLGRVVESVEKYNRYVLDQVKRARADEKFGRDLLGRWNDIKAKIPLTRTPTGVQSRDAKGTERCHHHELNQHAQSTDTRSDSHPEPVDCQSDSNQEYDPYRLIDRRK